MILEVFCIGIVLLYVVVRAKLDADPRRFLMRMATFVAAGWVCEDTVIRAYGFYFYSPDWTLFLDHVPVMIILIWPVVIHSAWDLAGHLLGRTHRLVPLLASAIVLADASLIEPIAVEAGLWTWTEPGLFRVPPIGILGWALFAFFAIGAMQRKLRFTIPVALLGTHASLLLLWWIFFRWVNDTVPAWPVVGLAWVASLLLALLVRRRHLERRVPLVEMLLRVPAALFFFVLLAIDGLDVPALCLYALAFAPPYVLLTPWKS